jgi:uncharacterized protein (DUF952 family)
MNRLFHIIAESDWLDARRAGCHRPVSLTDEGFIHCSFEHQVAATLQRHYAGVADLVVLEIDPALLDVPLKVEDTTGRGEEYPHLYGPLPVAAVVGEHPTSAFR